MCQRYKTEHHLPRGYFESLEIPKQRWQSIYMDWLNLHRVSYQGQLYNEVLTVTDRATKMVHLIPTSNTSTALDTASQFITQIVRLHGLPRSIVSDRDSVFTSQFWRAICQALAIKHRMSSPFHPQTNGQAERTNQTMKQVLRTLAASRSTGNWVPLLSLVEKQINHAPIATTEFSPFYLNYGFHHIFQFDVPMTERDPLPAEQLHEHVPQFLKQMQVTWDFITALSEKTRSPSYLSAYGEHVNPRTKGRSLGCTLTACWSFTTP